MELWVFAVTSNVIMACIAARNGWEVETVVAIASGFLWGVLLWP